MSGFDRRPSERADICIVGAGPAGALTAHSLAIRGYDVVVLEAGPRFEFGERHERMEKSLRPAHSTQEVWDMGGRRDRYTSSGGVNYDLNNYRVKGIGGSSLHWAGSTPRLHQRDFETNSRYGLAEDWPINYHELRPYYARAEAEMGVAGTEDNPFAAPREQPFPMEGHPPSYADTLFRKACSEVGIAIHGIPKAINSVAYDGRSSCVGYGTCVPVCPSGAKYSATVHVQKAEEEGCRVIDNATVRRIEHDVDGESVTALVYSTPSGETYRQTARQFVIAGGAVEIPRLLLLSRSEEYPDGLANSSGLVGNYFMEHPAVGVQAVLSQQTRQGLIGFSTSSSHQYYDREQSIKLVFQNQHRRLVRSALTGTEPFSRSFMRALSDPYDMSRWGEAFQTAFDGPWGDELLELLRDRHGQTLSAHGTVEMPPRKENRITLDTSKTDENGDPVPDVSLTIGPHERAALEEALGILNRIFGQFEYSEMIEGAATQPGFGAHHMGTTRMGTNPRESVVDEKLQTHDVDNLWIVSSSVFVTGGALNPTLTIGALALRTGEFIDEALSQR